MNISCSDKTMNTEVVGIKNPLTAKTRSDSSRPDSYREISGAVWVNGIREVRKARTIFLK